MYLQHHNEQISSQSPVFCPPDCMPETRESPLKVFKTTGKASFV